MDLATIPDLTSDEDSDKSNKENINIVGSMNLGDLAHKINAKKI